MILKHLFYHQIDPAEVQVVELEAPLQIVGLSTKTSDKTIAQDSARLGKRFQSIRPQITNRREPWAFAALSKDYDQSTRTFWYMMGDVVDRLEGLPAWLEFFWIPAGTYAVFPVRPRNRLGWGFAIGNAKRYAYKEWLPACGYQPAGTIDDFEYHDTRSEDPKNPQIDLYVAVKRP